MLDVVPELTGPDGLLRIPPSATTSIRWRVEVRDARRWTGRAAGDLSSTLVVVPEDARGLSADPARGVEELVQARPAALVVPAAHAETVMAQVKRLRSDVPVLTPREDSTCEGLLPLVRERLVRGRSAFEEQTQRLMREQLRLYREKQGAGTLPETLREVTGALRVVLVDRMTGGREQVLDGVPSTAAVQLFGPGIDSLTAEERASLEQVPRALKRVLSGQLDSANWSTDAHFVRVYRIGSPPYRALAWLSRTPCPNRWAEGLPVVADLIGQLEEQQQNLASRQAVRIGVVRQLLDGTGKAAAWDVGEAVPREIFASEWVQICLIKAAPSDSRAELAAECEGAVPCLAAPDRDSDEYVVVVRPRDRTDADPPAGLRSLIAAKEGRALGVSAPVEWTDAPQAWEHALTAVAVAEHRPDRVANMTAETPLAEVLPAGAVEWARQLLSPLTARKEERSRLSRYRLVLELGPAEAAQRIASLQPDGAPSARWLGRQLDNAVRAVQLPTTVAGYAAFLLALLLMDLPPARTGERAPTLRELFASRTAQQHASAFLAGLDDIELEGREETETFLRCWLREDAVDTKTAEVLGISRNTVRAKRERVERHLPRLSRPLGEQGIGRLQLYWALAIKSAGASDDGLGIPDPTAGAGGRRPVEPLVGPSISGYTWPKSGSGQVESWAVYNYLLGGEAVSPSAAETAEELAEDYPDAQDCAVANHLFLIRAITYLASPPGEDGIHEVLGSSARFLPEGSFRQFLDGGCGLPPQPALFSVAQQVRPDARYVGCDIHWTPVFYTQAEIADHAGPAESRTACVLGDVTEPGKLLSHPDVAATFDLEEPVAVLAGSLPSFYHDGDSREMFLNLMAHLPEGSALVLTHATADFVGTPQAKNSKTWYRHGTRWNFTDRAGVERIFDGYRLLAPGIRPPHGWRPWPGAAPRSTKKVGMWAGIGICEGEFWRHLRETRGPG